MLDELLVRRLDDLLLDDEDFESLEERTALLELVRAALFLLDADRLLLFLDFESPVFSVFRAIARINWSLVFETYSLLGLSLTEERLIVRVEFSFTVLSSFTARSTIRLLVELLSLPAVFDPTATPSLYVPVVEFRTINSSPRLVPRRSQLRFFLGGSYLLVYQDL